MALTIGEISKKIPDGVREVGSRKGFKLGVGYTGGDGVQDGGAKKISFSFNFYYPGGTKKQCDIGLPNKLFQYGYYKLDDIANIPALKISEENVIKLRIMYMIGAAQHGMATHPEFETFDYLGTTFALSIDNFGVITEKKFEA